MTRRLLIPFASLLIAAASPVAAQDRDMVIWDAEIAAAISERLAEAETCRPSPYAFPRRACQQGLSLDFERPAADRLTLLDQAALAVHRYRHPQIDADIFANTKLKFQLNLADAHEGQATGWITLRFRW